MDNKLKLCIAICDKLPPEEATVFNNAVAVSITLEQDQQLLHHTAILRLERLLKVIPHNTNPYYQDSPPQQYGKHTHALAGQLYTQLGSPYASRMPHNTTLPCAMSSPLSSLNSPLDTPNG